MWNNYVCCFFLVGSLMCDSDLTSEVKDLLDCLLQTLPEESLWLSILYSLVTTSADESHLSQCQVFFLAQLLKCLSTILLSAARKQGLCHNSVLQGVLPLIVPSSEYSMSSSARDQQSKQCHLSRPPWSQICKWNHMGLFFCFLM
jgi:hypothetical protein